MIKLTFAGYEKICLSQKISLTLEDTYEIFK